MTKRFWSGLWVGVIVACAAFAALRVRKGNAVDTSILSLLPASEGDPLLTQANLILSQRASRMMGFVVGHSDAATTLDIAQHLKDELKQSAFVQYSLTELAPEQQKAFYDVYFPLRYQMLSPGDRQRLVGKNPLEYFVGRLTDSLYSPASSFLKELIPKDPFLLFPELIRSWAATALPRGASQNGEGISFVDKDGTSYAFAAVELALDPFDSKNQDRMMPWLADLRKSIRSRWPSSQFYVTGALPFATAERERTEREMKRVSLGSLIGVLLLTFFVFYSLRALLLAALPITVGFVVAVAATLLCFGKIHIITFAFGSSLIGVAIDYPLLYLACHRTASDVWDPQEALRQIRPGLLLGAATTLMGYVALSLAPFPGLRQMALFSSAGLSAALITVLLWLPGLLTKAPGISRKPRILSVGKQGLAAAHRAWNSGNRRIAAGVLIALAIFTMVGLSKLRFDDDIRRFQSPSESLQKEDAFVRRAMNGFGGDRFILVRGATLEELLQRQELLQATLRPLLDDDRLSSIQSLAPFLPSLQRQQEDRNLLQKSFLADGAHVRTRLSTVGLTADVATHFLEDLNRPVTAFSVDAWLQSPASQLLSALWIGSTPQGYASAVLVGGLSDPGVLKKALKNLSGVRFFDQIEEYSDLFRRYRHLSMGLILVAYLGVWALMMLRYGRRRGTWVTAPSIGGVLFTFALFGWFGVRVQLIHCLSALLVLSMGIDYTIYFAECARAHRPVGPTLLAVELCACSALLSFGLLALCRTPILSSIGLTVFIGMAVAFLLAPLPYLETGV